MVVLLRASPAERPLAREPGSLQGEPVPGVRPSDPEQVSAPLSFPCLRFLPCCELGQPHNGSSRYLREDENA